MAKPLTLYAIQVTHLASGEKRANKVFGPELQGVTKIKALRHARMATNPDAARIGCERTQKQLGCKCRVVEFREVTDG